MKGDKPEFEDSSPDQTLPGSSYGSNAPKPEPTTNSPDVPPIETISNVKLLRLLGRGGMGEVWLGEHQTLGVKVAVKLMLPELAARDPVTAARFVREAQIAAKIDHPNVVRVLDAGQEGNWRYIIQQFVEGGSTGDLLMRGPLAYEDALRIIKDTAQGLMAAAAHDIVHRDIKPDNLLLTKDGQVKLADLGLAKSESLHVSGSTLAATMSNHTLGSPYYMAPEQIQDPTKADARSDIYALGATLFHFLAGDVPYPGNSMFEVMKGHLEMPIPNIQDKRPDVPQTVQTVLEIMLAKKPEDRYQSAEELLSALNALESRAPSIAGTNIMAAAGTAPIPNLQGPPITVHETNAGAAGGASDNRGMMIAAGVVGVVIFAGIVSMVLLLAMRDPKSDKSTDAADAIAAKTTIQKPAKVKGAKKAGKVPPGSDVTRAIPDEPVPVHHMEAEPAAVGRHSTRSQAKSSSKPGASKQAKQAASLAPPQPSVSEPEPEPVTQLAANTPPVEAPRFAPAPAEPKQPQIPTPPPSLNLQNEPRGEMAKVINLNFVGQNNGFLLNTQTHRLVLYGKRGILVRMMPRPEDIMSGRAGSSGVLLLRQYAPIVEAVLSSDGDKLATAGEKDAHVRVVDVSARKIVNKLAGHRDTVRSLSLSPNDRFLLSGSDDGTMRLWDLLDGSLVREYGNQKHAFGAVRFLPSASTGEEDSQGLPRWAVSGEGDGTIRLWNLHDGTPAKAFQRSDRSPVVKIAVTADAQRVIAGSENGIVRVFDVRTRQIENAFRVSNKSITSFAPDVPETELLITGDDGAICLYNLADNHAVEHFQTNASSISDSIMVTRPPGAFTLDESGFSVWRTGPVLPGMMPNNQANQEQESTSERQFPRRLNDSNQRPSRDSRFGPPPRRRQN